ncbi:MAG: ATP synthase subunit delta, sodium ion specific [Syntrophorhabdaceae bacterium PtaU1.Bin034]|nr:MAG: ATP synthase subunit delta, sodium ion specific [Syntrophorhabdaceae bacterium PtaU1.Bin034]
MISQSIARRYAKGLFAAGEKDGKYKDYRQQLEEVVSITESEPRMYRALILPLLEMDKRKEILADLTKVLGSSPAVAALLNLLLEKNRMNYLPSIRDAYEGLVNDKEGMVKGLGFSAYPVSDATKAQIEKALGERLNKRVLLEIKEDKSLIGGIKVAVGGIRIDGSVKRQLELLNESMMKE